MLSLSLALFRALLILYPQSFRERFGREMAQVFQDSSRAALSQSGLQGIVLLWLTVYWDLVATALVERIAEVVHMSISSAGRWAGSLGAIGGVVWIVVFISMSVGNGSDPAGAWVGVASSVMLALGTIGLYLRTDFGIAGKAAIAVLFLGQAVMVVGLGVFAALDAESSWIIWVIGGVLTLLGGAAVGLQARSVGWHASAMTIIAWISLLGLTPFAISVVFDQADLPWANTVGQVLSALFFVGIGLGGGVLGLLAAQDQVSEIPPAQAVQ